MYVRDKLSHRPTVVKPSSKPFQFVRHYLVIIFLVDCKTNGHHAILLCDLANQLINFLVLIIVPLCELRLLFAVSGGECGHVEALKSPLLFESAPFIIQRDNFRCWDDQARRNRDLLHWVGSAVVNVGGEEVRHYQLHLLPALAPYTQEHVMGTPAYFSGP